MYIHLNCRENYTDIKIQHQSGSVGIKAHLDDEVARPESGLIRRAPGLNTSHVLQSRDTRCGMKLHLLGCCRGRAGERFA